MAKIIQLCPASRHEEGDVLMYALDDEGNVFKILEGEDTELAMAASTYAKTVEIYRKEGGI